MQVWWENCTGQYILVHLIKIIYQVQMIIDIVEFT